MRRVNIVLLATLQLCNGRQHSFSYQDDLLAYPQFEIIFSDTYISESDARALLETKTSPKLTYTADFESRTDLARNIRESSAADADATRSHDGPDSPQVSETYELMSVPPSKYLCTVPVLAPSPALNQTATDLAKAEEARELNRANARGWELINEMEGSCLYFLQGWWSYSFCYGRDIVQFHAVPNTQKGGPPMRDPMSQEYVLGRTVIELPSAASKKTTEYDSDEEEAEAGVKSIGPPPNTELQVKGDQRYLVQRLEAGTICDLTGRDRTVEVQYHCAPNSSGDRISWIKEITTCTYLMVVHTPRLCADTAFLPPVETRAHPVSCRLVISNDKEEAAWREQKTIEAIESMGAKVAVQDGSSSGQQKSSQQNQPKNSFSGMTIGGVVVGGKQVLGSTEDGQPVAKLPPPRHLATGKLALGNGNPLVEVLALARSQAEGGDVELMSNEELEKLDLNPEAINKVREELKKLAGDKGWKLEIVEAPGGVPEIRGVIDSDEDGTGGGQGSGGKTRQRQGQDVGKDANKEGKEGNSPSADDDALDASEAAHDDWQEGSEEKFFRDEL